MLAPPPRAGLLPRETPVFNLLDVFLVLAGGFFILVVAQLGTMAIAAALPRFAKLPIEQLAKAPLVVIPSQVVGYIFLIGFIHLLLLWRHGKGLLEAIPFTWPRGSTAALAGTGVALALAIQYLSQYLPIPKQLPIDEYFRERTVAFVMLGFGLLIAPVVEELFFRGLLYPVLNRLAGTVFSLVITSALFALLHGSQLAFSWAPLLALFLVGLALTLVRARYRSVTACILMHMAYNATLFAFLLIATNGFRNLEVLTR